ncbi:uncharacterized protein DUF2194 [Kineothrix alysoides]|uniref:Uncharacterized protein DUF2194 n=1 Tax=Kineothrix alysoides TaxID=1469948 RepID=A0A4V2QBX3_9FIRM|nr:DUF2194 domain-containing protein [Kineothrix alysoides]TCL58107.1 uncharacterized protein DUF2194 [Kineothrix alysoides]
MISKGNYFVIFILLFMVFFMFMFAGVSSHVLSDASENIRAEDKAEVSYEDREVFSAEQKKRAAILSSDGETAAAKLLEEWCIYNKYSYQLYTSWVPEEEIDTYDLLLFSDYKLTAEDSDILYSYANLGKTMIFTKLPDYSAIVADPQFAAFFGIKAGVEEEMEADGIKIFSDFMLSKERVYKEGDYFGEEDDTRIDVPYYSLASGYEVYAVGILDNQKELGIEDKELPPLLWKTTTEKSFVFAVNSDVFNGVPLLGILTGFMAQEGDVFLYPIVNAQTISVLNYPYFSGENDETMQKLYSRSSEAVARDLLWSGIVQILKNYGSSYSFFASPKLDYAAQDKDRADYLSFYLREISKLPGDMGLSFDHVSDTGLAKVQEDNEQFLEENLPEYGLTALYAADFKPEEIAGNADYEHLRDIRLIMSGYEEGDSLIDFLDDGVLSVKFNQDGYQHETMDDLRMICVENALGMCNMEVDIGRVFYPESDEDEWNNLSLEWSKGDTYFKDFSKLDMVSVYEMEKRIRRFMALDYIYEREEKGITVRMKNFEEEAYFVLCTYNNSVESAENADVEKLSDTAWLIRALAPEVRIYLTEENVLEKPKNNKTVPSNPQ